MVRSPVGDESNSSMHTGHAEASVGCAPLPLTPDPSIRLLLCASLGTVNPVLRDIPVAMETESCESYIAIAQRNQIEQVNTYSVLCHGLQHFLTVCRFRKAAE